MTQITGNLDMYVYLICHALQINEKAKKEGMQMLAEHEIQ